MEENIQVKKVTLNIGCGRDQRRMDKGAQLIKELTGKDPVKTVTQKKIAGWGLRPGLALGLKLTLRGKEAEELLARMIYARDNRLPAKSFNPQGLFSFGVKEYVDIKDAKYNPDIGMMGLEVAVTLEKPGYRVKKRQIKPAKLGDRQRLTREQAMKWVEDKYKVTFEA